MLLFRVKKDVVDGCAILAKIIRFSNFSRRHFFTLMIFKFSKSEFYKMKLTQKELKDNHLSITALATAR
mgnify:CR=1 FL=1